MTNTISLRVGPPSFSPRSESPGPLACGGNHICRHGPLRWTVVNDTAIIIPLSVRNVHIQAK